MAVTATLVALAVTVVACGSTAPSSSTAASTGPAPTTPLASAQVFLHRYVMSNGRVSRIDQGGDTVSEGQAYALLLDVATGDRAQFVAVWNWSRANLRQGDGLLAFHWQNGKVVDSNAASDADLDIARALVLAGARWHAPSWTNQGKAYAGAILDHETVSAGGKLWLVAGPWARTSPYYLDPSYFDPATFALLGSVTRDPRWARVEASSAVALAADTSNGTRLPSDWAAVQTSGQVQASAPPGGGATLYGYDAFRTLIRQADGCRPGATRQLVAKLLPLAEKTASAGDRADNYNQDATPSQSGDNPLMLVAAAGAAGAAGDDRARDSYLAQASASEQTQPSYYLDAWVALGRYFLTTNVLAGCNP